MQLRDLQLAMQQHLLGGDTAPMTNLVVDAPPLPPSERLAIYKNGYRSRLIDALADTHPILLRILGDEDFAMAAGGFIDSMPSVHRSIRWYGRELAAYLARRAPFEAQPIFAELARFEWTLSEVFDAEDAPSMDREALQKIAPEVWGELHLEFHPSVRQLCLSWNTVPVWRAMNRNENPPDPEAADPVSHWIFWRQDFQSHFRSLEQDERAALLVALRGERFAQLCEALAPYLGEADIPMRAATFVAGWIDSGMVRSATVGLAPDA